MKLFTNAGYVSEVLRGTVETPSTHNDVACEKHAPKKGSDLWKRQGWRICKDRNVECKTCKYNRELPGRIRALCNDDAVSYAKYGGK